MTGLAVASGPLVGGAIVEGLAWQWIFWLNVPSGSRSSRSSPRWIPESRGPDKALDLPGVALVTAGLLGVVWGLVRGNPAGWDSAEVSARWSPAPRCSARSWRGSCAPGRRCSPCASSARARSRRATRRSSSRSASLFCGVFFMAQFLQVALGRGPLGAGLRLLPWTATLFFVAPVAGALVDRLGERPFLVLGPLLQAVGMGWLALIAEAGMPYAQLIAPLMVAGVGISMSFPAAQNAVVARSRGGDRQGVGDEHDAARARGRVRHRDQRGVLVGGQVHGGYASPHAPTWLAGAGLLLPPGPLGAARRRR